jgi:cell division protein FtsQ
MAVLVAAIDGALGRLMGPLADLVPRRIRRAAEKLERGGARRIGQLAATGFLAATIFYGLFAGGQLGRLGDTVLALLGFGLEDIRIAGHDETSEIAVLEQLEGSGSLVLFDLDAAQARVAALPWVARVSMRKFYPRTLIVDISERTPFALWQRDGEVFVIDDTGTEIVPLEESRFGTLPFMVGEGANEKAAEFFIEILAEPEIVEQLRAAVLVSGRRWDLQLDNGVTVKLPEKNVREALAQLVRLDAERQLLARDVVVVDLRLPDRVTVRLPEGRSLEDITSDGEDAGEKARI